MREVAVMSLSGDSGRITGNASRRRPLKPDTIYGWQHCLDRWILPNLANKLVSEVGNGALRQFVEILTAARLAPKTIVNVVTVVKFVVASAVDVQHLTIRVKILSANCQGLTDSQPCPCHQSDQNCVALLQAF
jgi:hypothetical protein